MLGALVAVGIDVEYFPVVRRVLALRDEHSLGASDLTPDNQRVEPPLWPAVGLHTDDGGEPVAFESR